MKALEQVPSAHDNNDDNNAKPKVVRIFISQQEEETTNKLQDYNKRVSPLNNNVNNKDKSLSQTVKQRH